MTRPSRSPLAQAPYWAWPLAVALVMIGCPRPSTNVARRTLYFAGAAVAHVEERVVVVGSDRTVTRTATLEDTGERTELSATLDAQGFAVSARYQRGALRQVALEELAATAPASAPRRVALIDLLGHVQPSAPTDAVIVDLSSAEVIEGRIERRGAEVVAVDKYGAVVARANVEGHRTGPGVFFEGDSAPATPRVPVEIPAVEPRQVRGWRMHGIADAIAALSADGPGQRRIGDTSMRSADSWAPAPGARATRAEPFIESEDQRVIEWARSRAHGSDALAQAVALVAAIHPLVDARKRATPPAAVLMLERGGDCDGAAALLTAGLRALGTPARPVVGYRWVQGRFVPHAWTEVYTPTGWMLADAAAPRIGDDPTYLKLFDGLGGALTMGRVLGRLQLEPITAPGSP